MGSLFCARLSEPGACEVLELEFEGVEGSEAVDEDKSCDSKIEGCRDKQGIAQSELSAEVHRKNKTGWKNSKNDPENEVYFSIVGK